jgi:hypothetical protein
MLDLADIQPAVAATNAEMQVVVQGDQKSLQPATKQSVSTVKDICHDNPCLKNSWSQNHFCHFSLHGAKDLNPFHHEACHTAAMRGQHAKDGKYRNGKL